MISNKGMPYSFNVNPSLLNWLNPEVLWLIALHLERSDAWWDVRCTGISKCPDSSSKNLRRFLRLFVNKSHMNFNCLQNYQARIRRLFYRKILVLYYIRKHFSLSHTFAARETIVIYTDMRYYFFNFNSKRPCTILQYSSFSALISLTHAHLFIRQKYSLIFPQASY